MPTFRVVEYYDIEANSEDEAISLLDSHRTEGHPACDEQFIEELESPPQ
jgi:hypothetical protein